MCYKSASLKMVNNRKHYVSFIGLCPGCNPMHHYQTKGERYGDVCGVAVVVGCSAFFCQGSNCLRARWDPNVGKKKAREKDKKV